MKSTKCFHNRSWDNAAAVLGDVVGGRARTRGVPARWRGHAAVRTAEPCAAIPLLMRNGRSHPTCRVDLFHGSRGQRDARQTGTNAVIRYAGLAVAAARPQLQPAAPSDSVPCPEVGSRRDSR
jgi:hypothetical protein